MRNSRTVLSTYQLSINADESALMRLRQPNLLESTRSANVRK